MRIDLFRSLTELAMNNDVSISGQALALVKGIFIDTPAIARTELDNFIESEYMSIMEILRFMIGSENYLTKIEAMRVG